LGEGTELKRRRIFKVIVVLLLCVLSAIAVDGRPVAAASLSDYFSYTYEVSLDKSEIVGDEVFHAITAGKATCKKDFPVEISELKITSRVVARHQVSNTLVTLNPGYTVTIAPFPDRIGEVVEVTEQVPLQFDEASQTGTYEVIAELIEAKVKAVVWLPVTGYLPPSKLVGSVTYSYSRISPQPSLPDISDSDSNFIVEGLSLKPSEARIGEEVVISVHVTNTSERTGSYEAALKLNGVRVSSKDITLEPGASIEVAFPIIVDTPGSYTVEVNSLSDTLIVIEPLIDKVDGESNYWMLAALAVTGCVIVGIAIWLIARSHVWHRRKVKKCH
jgi:hypothetical protein